MDKPLKEDSKSSEVSSNPQDNEPLQKSQKKLSIKDFEKLRSLGKGSYAEVVLAKNISTKERVAIKIIDKAFIEREEKVEEVHKERLLLSNLNHPNIIRLHHTFQDKKRLYFVLDLAEKGDLKEFLRSQSNIL
jgi:serine/threonine protein kinase